MLKMDQVHVLRHQVLNEGRSIRTPFLLFWRHRCKPSQHRYGRER